MIAARIVELKRVAARTAVVYEQAVRLSGPPRRAGHPAIQPGRSRARREALIRSDLGRWFRRGEA
jgi:hypothetical protein